MKILIDINHPQHVLCFKVFIDIMKSKGHQILVISRNKEIEHQLLHIYNIPFIDRGKGRNSLRGKFIYFFKAIYLIYKESKSFKPDILLSFGTPYPAVAAWLLGLPHLSFNDTEQAKLHHILTDPFSKNIVTPFCYNRDLGKKQIRFNSFFELCYLFPKYFCPDPSVLELLQLNKNEKFIILRFVSWHAVHDVGLSGLSLEMKRKVVKELSKHAKVFITSENKLPEEFEKYKMKIPVNKMHDAIFYASLLFGESSTMASESAMLGTPSVFIDKIGRGYTDELQNKYNLVSNFGNSIEQQNLALDKGVEIITDPCSKSKAEENRKILLKESIDISAFMIWFIENYPQSVKIMNENPDYQYNFLIKSGIS